MSKAQKVVRSLGMSFLFSLAILAGVCVFLIGADAFLTESLSLSGSNLAWWRQILQGLVWIGFLCWAVLFLAELLRKEKP